MSKNALSEWQIAAKAAQKSKSKDPIFITTNLTREDADILLESNTFNRHVSKRLVSKYARQMSQGNWVANGECIKLTPDMELLDGQHRLMALQNQDKPIRMSLVFNIPKSAFEVTDTGKARSAPDILSIAGYKNVNALAAAITYLNYFIVTDNFSSNVRLTPKEVLEATKRWPQMQNYCYAAQGFKHLCRASIIQCFMYILEKSDYDNAVIFFNKLSSGEKLGKTSPILHLRNYLIKARFGKSTIDKHFLFAALVLCWNAYIKKTRCSSVLLLNKGDPYPHPIGVDKKKLTTIESNG